MVGRKCQHNFVHGDLQYKWQITILPPAVNSRPTSEYWFGVLLVPSRQRSVTGHQDLLLLITVGA